MIASFARQTVVRLRATTTTDRYNNEVLDWSDPDRLQLSPVIVEPVPGSETFDAAGGRLITRWLLQASDREDITTPDRVEYDGAVYDIDGNVRHCPSPSGHLDHLEILLKRRTTDAG